MGSSIVFTQRWYSLNQNTTVDMRAVGMINGVKTAGDGGYGGGFKHRTNFLWCC